MRPLSKIKLASGLHALRINLDARVKPAHDGGENAERSQDPRNEKPRAFRPGLEFGGSSPKWGLNRIVSRR